MVFAFTTLAAYGLLVPFTGFYWDDWPFAWSAKFLGAADFFPSFAPYRPFLAPIFYLTTSLIAPNPLYWQIFALLIRFCLGISAWWMFRQIWHDRPRLALLASLLILVFPGYSQHWVAFTHINQELIPFIFFTLSIGFTFKALGSPNPARYHALALLLEICGIFPTEYFFGMEGLRFLFLFARMEGGLKRRLTSTLRVWAPYLFIWILNAGWLIYYYKFGAYASYAIKATQTYSLGGILQQCLDAIWKSGIQVWVQVLFLTLKSPTAPTSLLTFFLIVLAFGAFVVILRKMPEKEGEGKTPAFQLMLIGVLAILLGRLPSLAAGLPLTLQSSYDRFMVSMMIGGSLLLIGLLEALFRSSRAKNYLFAFMIALGVGQQFFNANIFRRDWEDQGNIYWQMSWRMPGLKPGTMLLTHQMPIDYETDASFTAPINWMYAPDYERADIPYLMLYTEKRLGGGALPSLDPNIPIYFNYRTVSFNGNSSDTVVIYMPRGGCLRVLDANQGHQQIYDKLPQVLTRAIPLSDPTRIITAPAHPAQPMFFTEPEHTWCYYYTKAELALQMGDHQKAAALGRQAISLGYEPTDQNEWLIFIKANALNQDLQSARSISQTALQNDVRVRRAVCMVWKQLQVALKAENEAQIRQILTNFKCNSG